MKVVEEAWNSAFEDGTTSMGDAVKHVWRKPLVWDKQDLGELEKKLKIERRISKNAEGGRLIKIMSHGNMPYVNLYFMTKPSN